MKSSDTPRLIIDDDHTLYTTFTSVLFTKEDVATSYIASNIEAPTSSLVLHGVLKYSDTVTVVRGGSNVISISSNTIHNMMAVILTLLWLQDICIVHPEKYTN